MPKKTRLRTLLSVAALGAAVLLCLADSAEDVHVCTSTTLEKTLDVTTTCGGDHAGRVHFTWTGSDSSLVSLTADEWQLVSGDLPLTNLAVQSICSADNEPIRFDSVDFTFETATDGGASRPALCFVQSGNFGVNYDCSAQLPCLVHVTEVP
jgi:hypothetical protein